MIFLLITYTTNMADCTTFDEFAGGVLQLNAIRLEEEREKSKARMETMPALDFYFAVKTSSAPNVNEMHGAVSTVNLKDMLDQAWNAQQGCTRPGELPSNNCYIESLHILETYNGYPVDMQVSCRQTERIPGNFFSTKIKGDDGSHNKSRNALWIMNPHEQNVYGFNERPVFSSKEFVESKTFITYHRALSYDIDDHTSKIKGGNQVEYLSPTCRIKGGEVRRADWFLDVMYRNSGAFNAPVQSLSFPLSALNQKHFDDSEDSDDETDEEAHAISLRMNNEDWTRLKGAVNDSVVSPLRRSIMDLNTQPTIDFIILPEVEVAPGDDIDSGASPSQRAGSGYWQALTSLFNSKEGMHQYNQHPFSPRVMVKFRATVRFV